MSWVSPLLQWYHANKRTMPWRSDPRPYPVWVSEIMLQQTQVDTVIPYFNRFMASFPTVQDLATSDLDSVLKHWEGLGYYSRARNLHKAAQMVSNELKGSLPQSYEGLQKIPGIGPYCAAAIGSIAFGLTTPVVDGNVLRVFTRVWGIDTDIRDTKLRKELYDRLTPFIETALKLEVSSGPSSFNQAIMELGATKCTPTKPGCDECPIQPNCIAYQENRTNELPVKSKKAPVPHYNIGVGIVWQDGKVLIGKRREDQMLGGLWEFPGGKQKKGESIPQTIQRELEEETGLIIKVGQPYKTIKHAYTHFKITLHAYHCEVVSGLPKPQSATELRWESPSNLNNYAFPTANKKLLADL